MFVTLYSDVYQVRNVQQWFGRYCRSCPWYQYGDKQEKIEDIPDNFTLFSENIEYKAVEDR